MTQIDWAAAMITRYLIEKGASSVGVRRLHYWIVSLPEDQRLIPSRGKGKFRIYQNTKTDYQGLSGNLVKARIRELIPWDAMQDDKNDEPVYMPDRIQPQPAAYIQDDNEYEPIRIDIPDAFPDFNTYLEEIRIEPAAIAPQFVNQSHRIVVVIEKATSRDRLKNICERYGADLLVFSGQLSLTRVYDVVRRAQEEGKPIALFYISDLDCAGWYMPRAFFNRIQEIYPNEDHLVVRIALNRDQANEKNLPAAFDLEEKGYSNKMKANFRKESGGDKCIELDALSERDLLSYLVKELSDYAGLEEDNRLRERTNQETTYLCENIESGISDILGDLENEYTAIRAEYISTTSALETLINPFYERIQDLNTRREEIQEKINYRLMYAMDAEGLAIREAIL